LSIDDGVAVSCRRLAGAIVHAGPAATAAKSPPTPGLERSEKESEKSRFRARGALSNWVYSDQPRCNAERASRANPLLMSLGRQGPGRASSRSLEASSLVPARSATDRFLGRAQSGTRVLGRAFALRGVVRGPTSRWPISPRANCGIGGTLVESTRLYPNNIGLVCALLRAIRLFVASKPFKRLKRASDYRRRICTFCAKKCRISVSFRAQRRCLHLTLVPVLTPCPWARRLIPIPRRRRGAAQFSRHAHWLASCL